MALFPSLLGYIPGRPITSGHNFLSNLSMAKRQLRKAAIEIFIFVAAFGIFVEVASWKLRNGHSI